jgi:membrane protein
MLMWIYFSSAVLLLSASVARSWADESVIRRAARAGVKPALPPQPVSVQLS